MSKTNSNSITSILTVALNQESSFRNKVLDLFEQKIGKKIDREVQFYNCTHSPLLYREMNGKEIDIIARVSGKHKPLMMIEVKASCRETLQGSQKKGGEYQKTSEKHGIPLLYIIPREYRYKRELPSNAKKLFWEDIKKNTEKISINVKAQISQFVEIFETEGGICNKEKDILSNRELLLKTYKIKKIALEKIEEVLNRNGRVITYEQEDQWGVGKYYKDEGTELYIGFNPQYSEIEDGKYFLAFCIAENCDNTDLGDRKSNPLFFDEGYYFLPILNDDHLDGDQKVLSEIREELTNIQIHKDVKKNFKYFYSLRSKIGKEQFDKLFINNDDQYKIDEKKYNKILEKFVDK